MSDIILAEFTNELTLDNSGKGFVSRRGIARMAGVKLNSVQHRINSLSGDQEKLCLFLQPFAGLEFAPDQQIPDSLAQALIKVFAYNGKEKAQRMDLVLSSVGMRQAIRSALGWIDSVQSDRERLETQILPKASLKDINYVARMMRRVYGAAYEQEYLTHQLKRHAPELLGPSPTPEQLAPAETTKALFRPTDLARELGLFNKSGNPDARAANKLLEALGYQAKVNGQWQPTQKGQSHAEVKHVDTDSRTAKNQLFWLDTILPILQEHVAA